MAKVLQALQALALVFSAGAAHAASASCGSGRWSYTAETGSGQMKLYDHSTAKSSTIKFSGEVTWAAQLPGGRLALCNEAESKIIIFTPGSETFVDIALGDLTTPVGAVVFEGKVWVACFGSGGKSGIAVVDPEGCKLEATYEFPLINGAMSYVHNIYAFTIQGKTDIYVAGFGNPWANPKVPGTGMVKFDRSAKEFVLSTTEKQDMNVRSIAQQSDEVFYVLEQIPGNGQSVLSRLKPTSHDTFQVIAKTLLPARDGDGGADVFLGPEANSVFATDRIYGGGKLYYYVYNDTEKRFHCMAGYDTGNYPRYTTSRSNGDVVACNKEEDSISIFEDLMKQPVMEHPSIRKEPSVPKVSFFIGVCEDSADEWQGLGSWQVFGVPLPVDSELLQSPILSRAALAAVALLALAVPSARFVSRRRGTTALPEADLLSDEDKEAACVE